MESEQRCRRDHEPDEYGARPFRDSCTKQHYRSDPHRDGKEIEFAFESLLDGRPQFGGDGRGDVRPMVTALSGQASVDEQLPLRNYRCLGILVEQQLH